MASANKAANPLSERERHAWCFYDFANSAFHQAIGAVFVPLLLDTVARDYAWSEAGKTQLERCDNSTQTQCLECVRGKGDMEVTIRGLSTGGDDVFVDAKTPKLPGGVSPGSFAFLITAISVFIQALVFISLGTFGNYSNWKERGMKCSSRVGCLFSALTAITTASDRLYGWGGFTYIVANVSLGTSVVFYNAYLPLMVDREARVLGALQLVEGGADDGENNLNKERETATNDLSSSGQGWGYVGGTSALILGAIVNAICYSAGLGTKMGFAMGILINALWWFVFAETMAFPNMPDGHGKKIPEKGLSIFDGWRSTASVLRDIWHNDRPAAYFLIMFFFFSDGYSTMATVSLMFAVREMCMGSIKILGLAVIVPLFAGIGNFVWLKIQGILGWSTKKTLVINLLLLGCLPLWGCIGFFTDKIGLQTEIELFLLAMCFGLTLGSSQAYARAQFTEIIPEGRESDLFAIYEITDKGSSWLGPLVATLIVQSTDKIRPILIYLACELLLPALVVHGLNIKQAARGT